MGKSVSEAIALLEQASKCRRLAALINDETAREALHTLATECEARALAVQQAVMASWG